MLPSNTRDVGVRARERDRDARAIPFAPPKRAANPASPSSRQSRLKPGPGCPSRSWVEPGVLDEARLAAQPLVRLLGARPRDRGEVIADRAREVELLPANVQTGEKPATSRCFD